MTNDKGTIKIPRDDFERHNERRKGLGLEWAEYIDGSAPQHDIPDAGEIGTVITMSIRSDLKEAAKDGAREAIEEAQR